MKETFMLKLGTLYIYWNAGGGSYAHLLEAAAYTPKC